jgi:predicted AAA+ superfamily ATPase
MIRRTCRPLLSSSFFLFGARATGKTTFLRSFLADKSTFWVDLLDPDLESRYLNHPRQFYDEMLMQRAKAEWIVVDEVQKCPLLLNYVHKLIEETDLKFALTGSSARKLRRGAANLMAGRALLNELFPLTAAELDTAFILMEALHWGTLPSLARFSTAEEKTAYLNAYAHSYLKEEIFAEQLVRKMQPFRRFLEVSAQCHGTQLSYRKLGRELQMDGKTVQSYFQILEDTLVGFLLYPHHSSLRKSLVQSPKFYFFDLGVQRALARILEGRLVESTSAFGEAFEAFIVLEIQRHNSYSRAGYTLEYYSDGSHEIDLILSRGPKDIVAIEIKSAREINDAQVRKFAGLAEAIGAHRKIFISQDRIGRQSEGVSCLSWQAALAELFN